MLTSRPASTLACALVAAFILAVPRASSAQEPNAAPRGAPGPADTAPPKPAAAPRPDAPTPSAAEQAAAVDDGEAATDPSEEGIPLEPPHAPTSHSKGAASPRKTVTSADYVTRRYEPAVLPLIGGDSDIGVEFGAVGTLSYFSDGVKPYRWNMDLLASLSVKGGPSGAEVAQQNYLWQIDVPGLLGGKLRLNPEVSFNRTINEGYFGLGNASSGAPPPATAVNPDRRYEFIEAVFQARSSAKIELVGPLSAYFAVQYLYVDPTSYAGSVLASDTLAKSPSGGPKIYGTQALSLPSFAVGPVIDTRDDEIFPRKGMLHEIGVRVEDGVPVEGGVRYIEAGAILRGYYPLVGPLVLAGRFVANFQFGNVPFYDLFQAGPFDQKEMPGGSAGVRGVPVGRYSGPIKIVGNIELRAMLFDFTVLKQHFTIGGDAFFDTGRVWSDWTFHSPLDGTGLGLKYGVGGGLYLLWGQAALIRLEAAYSPDAVAENPTLPIGFYVEDGVMF